MKLVKDYEIDSFLHAEHSCAVQFPLNKEFTVYKGPHSGPFKIPSKEEFSEEEVIGILGGPMYRQLLVYLERRDKGPY